MPDSYVKKIKLMFEPDETGLSYLEQKLSNLGKKFKLSEKDSDSLKKAKSVQNELKQLKDLLSEFEGIETESAKKIASELEDKIKKYEKALGPSLGDRLKDGAKDMGKEIFSKAGDVFLEKLKDLIKGAWEELSNLLNYSRLSNANTRELAMKYGFSASQAYGWDQAMGMLGFQSEEDLYYANTKEIALFKEAFEKYSEKYQKLYDSGTFETLLEYQVEMKEFEQDMKLEVADFFMQNKDEIKASLKAIMKIAEYVLRITSFLVGSEKASKEAAMSDIVSSYSTNNSSVTNVKIDNTFNGIDSSKRENLTQLGALTTEQLIAALR